MATTDEPLGTAGLLPRLYLIIAPRQALGEALTATAVELTQAGPLRVLDGSRRFEARMERRAPQASKRTVVRRAYTCYQMESRLARQPATPEPLLVVELLAPFADERPPRAHCDYLMEQVIAHLQRLAQAAPVLVGVTPPTGPLPAAYLRWLAQAAGQIRVYETPQAGGWPRWF